MFPDYWSIGHGSPDQSKNVAYLLFLGGWSFSLLVLSSRFNNIWKNRMRDLKVHVRTAVVLAITVNLVGNWPWAMYDAVYCVPKLRHIGLLDLRSGRISGVFRSTDELRAPAYQFSDFGDQTLGTLSVESRLIWPIISVLTVSFTKKSVQAMKKSGFP